jgi:hypothetical protein
VNRRRRSEPPERPADGGSAQLSSSVYCSALDTHNFCTGTFTIHRCAAIDGLYCGSIACYSVMQTRTCVFPDNVNRLPASRVVRTVDFAQVLDSPNECTSLGVQQTVSGHIVRVPLRRERHSLPRNWQQHASIGKGCSGQLARLDCTLHKRMCYVNAVVCSASNFTLHSASCHHEDCSTCSASTRHVHVHPFGAQNCCMCRLF